MITKLKLIEIMNNEVRRKKNIQSLKKIKKFAFFITSKLLLYLKIDYDEK